MFFIILTKHMGEWLKEQRTVAWHKKDSEGGGLRWWHRKILNLLPPMDTIKHNYI